MDEFNEGNAVDIAPAKLQSSDIFEVPGIEENDKMNLEISQSEKDSPYETETAIVPVEAAVDVNFDKSLQEPSNKPVERTTFEQNENTCGPDGLSVPENLLEEKSNNSKSVKVELDSVSKNLSEKITELHNIPKPIDVNLSSFDNKKISSNNENKIINLVETFTDSSQSLSSELQSSAVPFESSSSSQEVTVIESRIDFENAIKSETIWKEPNLSLSISKPETNNINMEPEVIEIIDQPTEEKEKLPASKAIPEITIDDDTQPSASTTVAITPSDIKINFQVPALLPPPPPPPTDSLQTNSIEGAVNADIVKQEPVPIPIPLPPAPRKRGRPRKQVLPNPSPLVEWPNSQEFSVAQAQKDGGKRSVRGERRQYKKKKLDDDGQNENSTRRRRNSQAGPRKKRRSTYVPKRKLPPPRKKHSELENFQNFEEETRMSASEGPTGFSSRSGAGGDESQGSSATTDGHTRGSTNKKGRMEVASDGCKPVTVQQIVEYFWPPPSSLPHGEKPESLMIQEQITEYLGVKSFKRKYPSIKRRPVDMEERNYLQENGYVSENMCDMGLTAVYAADIIEIMYNDFPHKFDEYRKYTREKKMKEQRALREKQAAERADMDPIKEAIESTLSWNSEFNKTRREKRASCFDLQTFTVHFPSNRFKQISLGKPGHYPIALIPGQNTDYYKSYTSNELKYFPLNTVLYGPLRPNERQLQLLSGSDGSHSEIEDSSSSDESSSSSSEETQDTEETSSTIEEEAGAEVKCEKIEPEAKEPVKPLKNAIKTPKGRGRGKIVHTEQKTEPKKRLGRPPKIKVSTVRLKNIDAEIAELLKEEKLDISSRVIIHTCKMCHEEESKNKNNEFESFIECSQCKGKIHPSCIDLTTDMIPKISSYGWQCTDCKTCVRCGQSSNEDKMIFCDQCDRGYHIFCVGLSEVPSGNYICMVCKPNTTPDDHQITVENGTDPAQVKDETTEVKEEIKAEDVNEEKCN